MMCPPLLRPGKYLKREVLNLARFISVMKHRPLTWRLAHPYALVDRFEVLPALLGVAYSCERRMQCCEGRRGDGGSRNGRLVLHYLPTGRDAWRDRPAEPQG